MALFDAWEFDDDDLLDEYDDKQDYGGLGDQSMAYLEEEEESPMFQLVSKTKVDGVKYRHMAVSKDIVVIALSDCQLHRFDLRNPDIEVIPICSKRAEADSVHKVFVSPNGFHQIITMKNGDNFYLHSTWSQTSKLNRLKNTVIDSVGWNKRTETKETTGDFLLGTKQGQIFEMRIDPKEKKQTADEKNCKQVYVLEDIQAVTGLQLEQFPEGSGKEAKYFVMATTPTRVYQFVGGPTYEGIFAAYATNPEFYDLPSSLDYSELRFFSKYQLGLPKSFAWLTSPGIYYGNLLFGSQNTGDKVMTDTNLLPYPNPSADPARQGAFPQPPISFTITEFHFLLLYADKFQAICRLNEEVVYTENFANTGVRGSMLGIAHDPQRDTIFVFSDKHIYEVMRYEEDRHVWKLYLEKKQYETALDFCKTPEQRDEVHTAQAEHFFNERMFELAATYFAKTQRSFEEVALKFINSEENGALKTYLLYKLDTMSSSDATQLTIVCTWLTEIYLNNLNQLEEDSVMLSEMQEEFQQFLYDHKDHLNAATTFNLISSHGRTEELLAFATQIEDFERVISHHIQSGDYTAALEVLKRQYDAKLYYDFSPVLMLRAPKETVDAWMYAGNRVEPRKLIPALMRYQYKSGVHQGIRYLQFCTVKLGNTDSAIHNYLLSLYAQMEEDTSLLAFLNAEETYFDRKYALRLCTKLKKIEPCVHIYSSIGMYEEAVALSLEVDLDLAIQNANKPQDDEPLKKKLWLRIARHVVEKEQDIKRAISFLSQYDVLKIEDILPFFPDFVLIDEFKEEICGSLEDYNRHIEELKMEMDEATRSADLIGQDIKELRFKYGYVGSRQQCDLCSYPVLTRQFYLFPCQHVFHCDCFMNESRQHFSHGKAARVDDLLRRMEVARMSSVEATEDQDVKGTAAAQQKKAMSEYEQLKGELDEVVASECVFCGDIMIRSIEKKFVDEEMEAAIVRSWEI